MPFWTCTNEIICSFSYYQFNREFNCSFIIVAIKCTEWSALFYHFRFMWRINTITIFTINTRYFLFPTDNLSKFDFNRCFCLFLELRCKCNAKWFICTLWMSIMNRQLNLKVSNSRDLSCSYAAVEKTTFVEIERSSTKNCCLVFRSVNRIELE